MSARVKQLSLLCLGTVLRKQFDQIRSLYPHKWSADVLNFVSYCGN
jgi:hypothetical protein